MAKLSLELARLTGTSERWPYAWLDDVDSAINQLCSVVDTVEFERFERGSAGNQLCSYLDSIEHGDDNLEFLRLSADHYGRMPSWRIIKYRCKLANLSQSFYRCISVGQWRTVIEWQNQKHVIEIRSNVVPQQAYLTRFEGVTASCLGNGCTGGFFPTSVLRERGEPPFQSCANCALAEQLRGRAQMGGAVVRFWYLEEKDVQLACDHARIGVGSSEGEVYKVLWRKGIFAKKLFRWEFDDEADSEVSMSFCNEIEVAMEVSHPNIVHFFGYSMWESADHRKYEFSVFMELLDEDLESHFQEGDRRGELISFRDSLQILLQAAEAMKHVHEKDFVHGDLKPGNILLSQLTMPHSEHVKFYLVKVADFGRAQRVDSTSGETVKPFDSNIGSYGYTAPEVLRCREPYNGAPPRYPQKVDIYSFGVVAYQVLTGATDILVGYRTSAFMKPDSDRHQWRPHRNFDFGTLDPDRLSLLPLITRCLASSPESRPTFTQICSEIQSLFT